MFRKHIEDPKWRQYYKDDLAGKRVNIPNTEYFYNDKEYLDQ